MQRPLPGQGFRPVQGQRRMPEGGPTLGKIPVGRQQFLARPTN